MGGRARRRTMSRMPLCATELRLAKVLYADVAGDEYGQNADKLSNSRIARFDAHAHGLESASGKQNGEDYCTWYAGKSLCAEL